MDFRFTPEHEKIRETSRRLAADFATRTARHDREASLPVENYAALKQAGFYSLTVLKELGGWGAGFLGWTAAAEELAQGCPTTALTFNMHVASVEIIMDDPLVPLAMKQHAAKLVTQEQKLIAAAVSEPGTSSLLGGVTIVPSVQARQVSGGYTLRGRKAFLSLIEGCDYHFSIARLEGAAQPLAGVALLVPYPSPGQRIEEVWDTLGMRGTRSNNLILEDCFVAEEQLCFSTDNMLSWLTEPTTWGPGFSYTPVYLGVGVATYKHACEILKARVPRGFAQPLSYHPDIRHRIAEMNIDLEAARLLMYQAAWMMDTTGMTPATLTALCRAKYFVGEAVARITRSALTACGAHALFKTSPLEQLFRDGASAPIMPPSSDFCLGGVAMLELGLNPMEMLPPLKVAG